MKPGPYAVYRYADDSPDVVRGPAPRNGDLGPIIVHEEGIIHSIHASWEAAQRVYLDLTAHYPRGSKEYIYVWTLRSYVGGLAGDRVKLPDF